MDGEKRHQSGLTIIEIMIATVIFLITVLGTSALRYHSTMAAHKARLQATAARTALLLCETWRGLADPNDFEPDTYFGSLADESTLDINKLDGLPEGIDLPLGFRLYGVYEVSIDNINYYAIFCWKQIESGLKALNVTMAWNQRDYTSEHFGPPDKLFSLTSYVTD